jgi:hypothetical protein
MLLCAKDPRYFDLALLAARTRLAAFFTTFRFWNASSHSPLILDLPDSRGQRKFAATVRTQHRARPGNSIPSRRLPRCPTSKEAGLFSSDGSAAVPRGWDVIDAGVSP